MGQLQLRRFSQILTRMRNRVVARTDLTDMIETGAVNQVLAAAAREDDEQYFQMANLLDLFDLDKATGDDLDEAAAVVNPDRLSRLGARSATTSVTFSRAGITGDLAIPQGTVVQVPASGSAAALRFITTAAGAILDTFSTSAAIAVTADTAGSAYNVNLNTITGFAPGKPSGVNSVTNPSAATNGRDTEKDDAFRTRIKLYLKSLSRATTWALVSASLGVEAGGKTVVYAAVVEDMVNLGNVIIYIDDGSGTAEGTPITPATETVLASALGGEVDLYLANKPIKREAGYVISLNAAPQTEGTDYTLNPANGQLKFLTPLTTFDLVKADYTYWDGLIQEVQKVIDGDAADRENCRGYRAAGVLVRVMAPQVVQMVLTANIVVLQGWSQTDVATKVEAAVSSYINSLGISEDVVLNEIKERAMAVPGMYDIAITAPMANRVILDNQIARIIAGNSSIS